MVCGFVTDKFGATSCDRAGMSPTRRCMLRPPVPLLPDGAVGPPPALAKALVEVGLTVEGVAVPDGTELPVTDPVATGEGVGWASADTPVDKRLSLRVGVVDGGGGGGSMLVTPADGTVTVTCPGRLVNFRGAERAVEVEGEGEDGAGVLVSTVLESGSWR